MAPTPQSSSSGQSPEEQYRVVRKRNRVPLSCHPCRTRKKCDRGRPCANCVKREGSDPASCSYAAPATRNKKTAPSNQSPDDMQNRIDRLEGLVLSLMRNGAQVESSSQSPPNTKGSTSSQSKTSTASPQVDPDAIQDTQDGTEDTEEGQIAVSLGLLKIDASQGKSLYLGEQHWHAVLSDIAEVKNYFATHKKDLEASYARVLASKPPSMRDGPAFLRGVQPATKSELRAELPGKSQVEALITRYFYSADGSSNILHKPSFLAQLHGHWLNPNETSVMFLGLVYAVMCLAMLGYHKSGDEPPEYQGRSLEMANSYRIRTVQCLAAADYTSPVEHTIETMLLYLCGEYSTRWDADLGSYLIISMIVRLAYRMGYHRDAKWFKGITPFQAEMRRRVWSFVRISDIMFSLQVSLPSMIDPGDCDTKLPSNLLETDFGPDSTSLPSSRSWSDPTPIAYIIFKARFYYELAQIVKGTTRVTRPASYDEILTFDSRLNQIYKELPDHLRISNLENGSPVSIMPGYHLEITYQKIRCLLHRGYAAKARENPRYNHSRTVAVGAALANLGHLANLIKAVQPNGRLKVMKSYITTTAIKDFVLPAMLICVDLHYDKTTRDTRSIHSNSGKQTGFWTKSQRRHMIRMLDTTRKIWKNLSETNIDAYKASSILEVMLESMKTGNSGVDEIMNSPEDDNDDLCGFGSVINDPLIPASVPAPDPRVPAGATANYYASHLMGTGLPDNFFQPNIIAPFSDQQYSMPDAPQSNEIPAGFLIDDPDFNQTESNNQYAGMNAESPFTSMLNTMSAQSHGIAMADINWDAFDMFAQSNAAFSVEPGMALFGSGQHEDQRMYMPSAVQNTNTSPDQPGSSGPLT